jgi:acyl-CoA synthetase (AMP-forming)/AMP-acid ligase II
MQTTPEKRIQDLTNRGWWGDRTLLNLFDEAVASTPDHPALIDQFNRSEFTDGDARRLSFGELADAVDLVAAQLYDGGIRQEDIVVVQLPNIAELPLMYLALARLGAIASPVPIQYGLFELGKADELLHPAAFVSISNFKGKKFAEDQRGAFSESCTIFAFGDDQPEGALLLSLESAPGVAADYAAYTESLDISANDILTICWTSGTTGQPKGVPRSHNMWMASGRASHDVAAMIDGEAILNPFPMVNMAAIGGFLFPWMMRAATLVLHHPFDLPVFLKQLEQEKIAYTIAPPAVLNMLLKQRELLDTIDISNLRAIGSGGAPLSPWMVTSYQDDYNIGILNIFGSNEGMCLASDTHDLPNPADRAQFFPRFGVEGFSWRNRAGNQIMTRLVNLQSGTIVTKPGEQGELEISGSSVFDGYWKSPEANKEVFTEDGYFKTGDVFEIVDDGGKFRFYKFTGRCKDIIVRGGVNISPDEIDNLLTGHPKVAEAGVVGYDDEIMGEKVGAVIVSKPGETVTLDELTGFLREKGLAVFKLPEKLRCVDEIPHNATGKVLRAELKKLFDDAGS